MFHRLTYKLSAVAMLVTYSLFASTAVPFSVSPTKLTASPGATTLVQDDVDSAEKEPDRHPNSDEPTIRFADQIRPILSDKCFACHGPDDSHREADLRLDLADEAFADRGGYAAIVPHDLEASEVWYRIQPDGDESLRMPPVDSGKELTDEERDLIRDWIKQGASWSVHWAYAQPDLQLPKQLDDADDATPAQVIDAWIRTRLKTVGLQPSPRADRVTLLRRLSFDLTGLPPTSVEIDAFMQDESPDAYERVVDRLLASPHFGERMAVYWLDLVRFADTVGYHGDQDHNITPYRDYVIDAFNRDLPFDRFTREQLAGDLLPDKTTDSVVATGYNRLLQTSHEGGVQPKEYMAIYAADRVRNVSSVWMGATVGCAQCHNHKYDPYTIKDFYSLAAFFADVDEAEHFKVGTNALPTKRPPEISVLSREQREQVAKLQTQIDQLTNQLESSVTDEEKQKLEERLAAHRAEREAIEAAARMTMVTVAIEPRTMRVLPRGNWLDDSGPIVEPSIPEFLGKLETPGRRANRLDLANWLTDPQSGVGGLTARVMANRFWYLMFGTGLSTDLADFGGQGTPPTHPELLDFLALEFIDGGWSTKSLIKSIVMSETYQQSSACSDEQFAADPQNKYFGRQSRFRLPAEFIRDNALSISGLLVDKIGGASVKPYQPAGYYQHLNFPPREYQASEDEGQWRRGVYVHWQRQFLHPMLRAFDAPTREECTAQRPRSNTPLAAMVLMNDPTFVEAAKAFAARLLTSPAKSIDDRLDAAFQIAMARKPDNYERQVLTELHATEANHYQDHPESANELLSVGLSELNPDLDKTEWAAWTSVARVILNLSETMTRP